MTQAAFKTSLAVTFVAVILSLSAIPAHAQYGSLPIGSMTTPTSETCPGGGWYYYTNGSTHTRVNCYSTTVTGCAHAQDAGLDFGYLNPVGIVPTVTQARGVIVMHNGSGGTAPNTDNLGVPDGDFGFADYYFKNGYVIVQLAWNFPWQEVLNPWPLSSSPLGNAQLGACRPATFFNWVFNNIYLATVYNVTTNPHAGFCAQGFSAGDAATTYSMSYYAPPAGGQWWFDAVELVSGPPLSDIRQGCYVSSTGGHYADISVCGGGESWCHYTAPLNWTRHVYYTDATASVQTWTDDQSCNNGATTSGPSNTRWWQESIVDDGTNSPVFSYPNTAVSAWLCRGVTTGPTNNSSSQGYLYYQKVGVVPPLTLNLWAVDGCPNDEGAAGGTVSATGVNGMTAIELDMAGTLSPLTSGQCVH